MTTRPTFTFTAKVGVATLFDDSGLETRLLAITVAPVDDEQMGAACMANLTLWDRMELAGTQSGDWATALAMTNRWQEGDVGPIFSLIENAVAEGIVKKFPDYEPNVSVKVGFDKRPERSTRVDGIFLYLRHKLYNSEGGTVILPDQLEEQWVMEVTELIAADTDLLASVSGFYRIEYKDAEFNPAPDSEDRMWQ